MNRQIKKVISVILALSVIFCIFSPSFSASAESDNCPIVYVCGQGYTLRAEAYNSDSEKIYPISVDSDYILDTIHKLNPTFLKAIVTGDYNDYCDVICDAVTAKFEPIILDKSGEVTDGSGCEWNWNLEDLINKSEELNGNYDLFSFNFVYDWRLDPCDTATRLNAYINDVITATGSKKVNIVSRCLGCNIAAAYLVDYGYEKVNKCVFYASAIEGIDICNEAFNGQIEFDPDSIERFVYDSIGEYIDDDTIAEFIKTTVSVMNKTYGLNLTTDFVMDVFKKIEPNLVPRLLRATLGTMPSYLSMTNTTSYEKIKKYIFNGLEDEYAGTIAKSDNYHYNVQNRIREVLIEADESVDFMVIGKYGYQFLPLIESSDEIADGWLQLSSATFGATTAKDANSVFDDKYINNAKKNGTYKYISLDKQVDLSTCLFPDYTWVIKHIEHKDFPSCVNGLIWAFLKFDGQMTVNDYAEYPQYLVYDNEKNEISPMIEENKEVTNWNNDNIFTLLYRFISQLIPIIKNLIKNVNV